MLRSWLIREMYRPCRMHIASDLRKLYITSCWNIPKEYAKEIREYIKIIKDNNSFEEILHSLIKNQISCI
jgi:hypothetical protein